MLTDTESADVQKCFCEMRPFEEKGTMDIKKGRILFERVNTIHRFIYELK